MALSARSEPLPVQNLEQILSQSLGAGLKITHVQWKHLTDPGENFGSLILAVDVDVCTGNGKTRTLNTVVKLPPRSAYLLELFNSPVTFKKELEFYGNIVPALMEIQRECGCRDQDSSLVPRYFGGRLGLKDPDVFDDQGAIVLENLNYSGYKVQDRIYGLDKRHVEFAVGELAKLHALVICLKLKKPAFFEKVVMPALVPPANEQAQQCVLDMVNKTRNDLNNLEEAKPYLSRIDKTLAHAVEESCNAFQALEPWGTLVHNDFWVNNMMFRYDKDGKVVGMKIVDFQLGVYNYGMNDLIFFLMSSSRKDVLENHLDEMIDFYYESFVDCLKSLKVDADRFSKDEFLKHLNESAPFKFGQCLMMVQVIQASRGAAPKMENIDNKDVFLNMGHDDIYNRKLLQILSVFNKRDWLLR